MRILQTIGRMLLGGAIRRAMWRSPWALLICAVVVGLLLMFAGDAHAQGVAGYPSRAAAFAACEHMRVRNTGGGLVARCVHEANQSVKQYRCSIPGYAQCDPTSVFTYASECPTGQTWNDATNTCQAPCAAGEIRGPDGQCSKNCQAQPDRTIVRPGGISGPRPSGTTQCMDSCPVSLFSNGDGTYTGKHILGGSCDDAVGYQCSAGELADGFYNSVLLGGCVPNVEECSSGEVKDPITGECSRGCPIGMVMRDDGSCKAEADTCPPGNIKAPNGSCLPGEGQCASGEARGKDGTCKRDSDGDGVPDVEQGQGTEEEEGDGSDFSGGDNCQNPPACSGSAILCGQARIQWRIECNTRRSVNISGGHCAAMPVCIGDNCNAMEHAQLIQQWKTACALERLSGEGSPGIPGGGNGDGLLDWMKGVRDADTDAANAIAGQGDGLEGISEDDAWRKPQDGDGEGIRENLFGGGNVAQCSIAGGWTFAGQDINPGPQFWSLMQWIGWLMTALAYLWLVQKLGD